MYVQLSHLRFAHFTAFSFSLLCIIMHIILCFVLNEQCDQSYGTFVRPRYIHTHLGFLPPQRLMNNMLHHIALRVCEE